MGAYSLLKITISMSLACLPDSNKSISITKFFSLLGVKVSSHMITDCICVVYITERCQEGVKKVSRRCQGGVKPRLIGGQSARSSV